MKKILLTIIFLFIFSYISFAEPIKMEKGDTLKIINNIIYITGKEETTEQIKARKERIRIRREQVNAEIARQHEKDCLKIIADIVAGEIKEEELKWKRIIRKGQGNIRIYNHTRNNIETSNSALAGGGNGGEGASADINSTTNGGNNTVTAETTNNNTNTNKNNNQNHNKNNNK